MTETQDFHYEHDGCELTGKIAMPSAPGPHPAVLVMHSALGIDEQMCRRGAVTAKVLSITGLKDPYVPTQDMEAFQQEMTDAEVDWHVTIYGQGLHAFTMPEIAEQNVPGTAYDPLLDHLSWAQATTFLAATLQGAKDR